MTCPNGKEQLAIESVQLTAKFVSARISEDLGKKEDPAKAIQDFIKELAQQFQSEKCLDGVPIAAVALETSLVSQPVRTACQTAYESFQDAFTEKLLESGFEEKRAKELGIVINSMVEGAFLLSFTMGNSEDLLLVADQIPVLLK